MFDYTLSLQVFRHGARTPADTYPKDPYVNFDFAPFGWGQLTNVSGNDFLGMIINFSFRFQKGRLQIFENGKYFRTRYENFLGKFFQPDVSCL